MPAQPARRTIATNQAWFAVNWSAKLEYNYIDLGKVAPIQYTPTLNDRSEWKDTFHTVKLGINYHFNSPGPVVSAKY
ncbi:outer membrane protein [Bradyrhizobium sp. CCBAU 53421]|uniref:outer membrane protein n=1 Tax=Bradyrhizobium sp. CCBAU 53421 TaxID=1325120 RepID=UPI0035302F52